MGCCVCYDPNLITFSMFMASPDPGSKKKKHSLELHVLKQAYYHYY